MQGNSFLTSSWRSNANEVSKNPDVFFNTVVIYNCRFSSEPWFYSFLYLPVGISVLWFHFYSSHLFFVSSTVFCPVWFPMINCFLIEDIWYIANFFSFNGLRFSLHLSFNSSGLTSVNEVHFKNMLFIQSRQNSHISQ